MDDGKSFVDSLPEADVVVLAGDTGNAGNFRVAIRFFCAKYPDVVCVLGNHDYYLGRTEEVQAEVRGLSKRIPNLHWLNNTAVTIKGRRFIGTTLWFPEMARTKELKGWLNDFRVIRNFEPWVYRENTKAVRFLSREMRKGDIVVTHHLPTSKSVASEYASEPTNIFYVCDVEPLIQQVQPDLWVHGHTHSSHSYWIGETQIVCNPFGYARRQENAAFNPDLILEVADGADHVGSPT
jgi:Icc-related predicted phosphoesterase